jgi:hypothetical protein
MIKIKEVHDNVGEFLYHLIYRKCIDLCGKE